MAVIEWETLSSGEHRLPTALNQLFGCMYCPQMIRLQLKFVPEILQTPFGRPRRKWEDNIKMGLQEVGCGGRDWIELAQVRDRWRELVIAVMKLGEFLD